VVGLVPDERYLNLTMEVGSRGRGAYTFTVPKLSGHPHSHTVSVKPRVSNTSGTYLATGHFVIT
jgi:hypothetical protein